MGGTKEMIKKQEQPLMIVVFKHVALLSLCMVAFVGAR